MRTRPDPRDRLAPLRHRAVTKAGEGPGRSETVDAPTGIGGWVPSFGQPLGQVDEEGQSLGPVDEEVLATWAPPGPRGRHRRPEPGSAAARSVAVGSAVVEEGPAGDRWASADGRPGDPSPVDGWPGEPSPVDGWPAGAQGEADSPYGPDDAGAAGTVWTPDEGWGPPRDRPAAPRLLEESTGRDMKSTGQQADPADAADRFDEADLSDDADSTGETQEFEPMTARAHRINGRWGRFAELWVPEPLRNARLDPGRRGMVVLLLVAAVAATATAVGVWRDRPEPRPIETSTVAAASKTVPGSTLAGSASSAAVSAAPAPVGDQPAGEILVSVTGLVQSPGVVRVPVDARVADAITAAGGPAPGAVLTGMNLAAKLADGDSVVVSDAPTASAPTAGPSPPGAGGSASAPSGMVNLNTADAAALDTLPGVGPVMAQNIIAWRESNGRFTSVEQLQEISGIGPSRYAQISALVTVG